MFPLSSIFIFALISAAFYGFCALCFLSVSRSRPKSKWYILVPILGLLIGAVWKISRSAGGYDTLGVLFMIIGFLGFLLICGLWVWGLRALFGGGCLAKKWRGFVPVMGMMPAVVALVHFGHQQYVPASQCRSGGIDISVGSQTYHVRRDYGVVLNVPSKSMGARVHYLYSPMKQDKEDLRQICAFSKGGDRPINVTQMWILPRYIPPENRTKTQTIILDRLPSSCGYDDAFSRGAFCAGYLGVEWENIQQIIVTTRDAMGAGTMSSAMASMIENIDIIKKRPGAFAGGDRGHGYVCKTGMGATNGIMCQTWRETDGTIMGVSTKSVRDMAPAELLRQLRQVADFMFVAMTKTTIN